MDLADELGLTIPMFAFSDMPEVVAAVSKGGGIGVLGALMSDADELDRRLTWLDQTLDGRPYGVDVVITAGDKHKPEAASQTAAERSIPQGHRDFTEALLAKHGVPPLAADTSRRQVRAVGLAVEEESAAHIEIALAHNARVIVNALGPPPASIVERAHRQGVLVGALVGAVAHVERQLAVNVDFVIAQGTEAGGHCGEVTTMVLVPEVVEAVAGRVPVLAAGGIASGAQVVAALALGAAGVWTGSMWLATDEASPYIHPLARQKLLRASSKDTVRSRAMSGKPMRQLRTAWTDAWDGKDSPGCLPAPLQGVLHHGTSPRFYAAGAAELCGYPVGQVVGRMNCIRSVSDVLDEVRTEIRRLSAQLPERLSRI